jgi:hypothetical protein
LPAAPYQNLVGDILKRLVVFQKVENERKEKEKMMSSLN